jgi:hypothetical protein
MFYTSPLAVSSSYMPTAEELGNMVKAEGITKAT